MPIQRLGQLFTNTPQRSRNRAAATCLVAACSLAAWRSTSVKSLEVDTVFALFSILFSLRMTDCLFFVVLWRLDLRADTRPAACRCLSCLVFRLKPSLPPWLISGISGAVGECVGQIVLYPVETIKVLCQKHSQGAFATLRTLLCTQGLVRTAAILYHGVGTTVFVSMGLGAVYLGVFQAATRALSSANFEQVKMPVPSKVSRSSDLVHSGRCGKDGPAGDTATGGKSARDSSEHAQPKAALLAALLTSFVMAMLTGPLDMARNRVQAGLVSEPLLQYSISGRGLRDTLPLMGPFMLASVPHDFAELMLYFLGHNLLDKLSEESWPRCAIRQEVADAALGACAGLCAVILSMPADCLKTKVLTKCGPESSYGSIVGRERVWKAWLGAARNTSKAQGPRGFFVGLVPRAVDEVPGSMLHWTFAEGCTRWLEKF